MQMFSIDLIRLAVSGAAICAGAVAAELGGLHHNDQLANAKIRVASPIQMKTISVGAATLGAQPAPAAFAQSCSSVAPILRRLGEPQSRLALAP
jgi:hypothetical protein